MVYFQLLWPFAKSRDSWPCWWMLKQLLSFHFCLRCNEFYCLRLEIPISIRVGESLECFGRWSGFWYFLQLNPCLYHLFALHHAYIHFLTENFGTYLFPKILLNPSLLPIDLLIHADVGTLSIIRSRYSLNLETTSTCFHLLRLSLSRFYLLNGWKFLIISYWGAPGSVCSLGAASPIILPARRLLECLTGTCWFTSWLGCTQYRGSRQWKKSPNSSRDLRSYLSIDIGVDPCVRCCA